MLTPKIDRSTFIMVLKTVVYRDEINKVFVKMNLALIFKMK